MGSLVSHNASVRTRVTHRYVLLASENASVPFINRFIHHIWNVKNVYDDTSSNLRRVTRCVQHADMKKTQRTHLVARQSVFRGASERCGGLHLVLDDLDIPFACPTSTRSARRSLYHRHSLADRQASSPRTPAIILHRTVRFLHPCRK